MPRLVGFSRFAALPEDQISDKISRSILRRPRDDRPAVGTEPKKRARSFTCNRSSTTSPAWSGRRCANT